MPSTSSSLDPVKCGMVPWLGTPNVALSGLAFSQATNCVKSNCLKFPASTAGPTTTQNSKTHRLRDRDKISCRIERRLRLDHRQQVHRRTRGHENGGAVRIG